MSIKVRTQKSSSGYIEIDDYIPAKAQGVIPLDVISDGSKVYYLFKYGNFPYRNAFIGRSDIDGSNYEEVEVLSIMYDTEDQTEHRPKVNLVQDDDYVYFVYFGNDYGASLCKVSKDLGSVSTYGVHAYTGHGFVYSTLITNNRIYCMLDFSGDFGARYVNMLEMDFDGNFIATTDLYGVDLEFAYQARMDYFDGNIYYISMYDRKLKKFDLTTRIYSDIHTFTAPVDDVRGFGVGNNGIAYIFRVETGLNRIYTKRFNLSTLTEDDIIVVYTSDIGTYFDVTIDKVNDQLCALYISYGSFGTNDRRLLTRTGMNGWAESFKTTEIENPLTNYIDDNRQLTAYNGNLFYIEGSRYDAAKSLNYIFQGEIFVQSWQRVR